MKMDPEMDLPSTSKHKVNQSENPPTPQFRWFAKHIDIGVHAYSRGDYESALAAYEAALFSEPNNSKLLGNMALVLEKLERYDEALDKIQRSLEINPNSSIYNIESAAKSTNYKRKGAILLKKNLWPQAAVAFSFSIIHNPDDADLLNEVYKHMMESPLAEQFKIAVNMLDQVANKRTPFAVLGVIGQQLLEMGYKRQAATILENTLKLEEENWIFRSSAKSSLTLAYISLGNYECALECSKQALKEYEEAGDEATALNCKLRVASIHLQLGQFAEADHYYSEVLITSLRRIWSYGIYSWLGLAMVAYKQGRYGPALHAHARCIAWANELQLPLYVKSNVHVSLLHILVENRRIREALEVGSLLIHTVDQFGSLEDRAVTRITLGQIYMRCYSFPIRVTQLYKEASTIFGKLERWMYQFQASMAITLLCLDLEWLKRADIWARRLIKLAVLCNSPPIDAQACRCVGHVLLKLNALKTSALFLTRSIQIAEEFGDSALLREVRILKAKCMCRMRRHNEAIKLYRNALIASRQDSRPLEEVIALQGMCQCLIHIGDPEMANGQAAHLHRIAYDSKQSAPVRQHALCALADYLVQRQRYLDAITFYELYLTMVQEEGLQGCEIRACDCLGDAHRLLGAHSLSIRYYTQALSLAKQLGRVEDTIIGYYKLGRAQCIMGNFQEALKSGKFMLAMAHFLHWPVYKATALSLLADILVGMGKPKVGLHIACRALVLSRKTKDLSNEFDVSMQVAKALFAIGQYKEALEYYMRAESLSETTQDWHSMYTAVHFIGKCYEKLEDFPKVISCRLRRLEIASRKGLILDELCALSAVSETCIFINQHSEAITYLLRQRTLLDSDNGRAYCPRFYKRCMTLLTGSYAALNKWKWTAPLYEELIEVESTCPRSRLLYGLSIFKLRMYETAMPHFKRAIELENENHVDETVIIDALALMAASAWATRKFEMAKAYAERRRQHAVEKSLPQSECLALLQLGMIVSTTEEVIAAAERALALAVSQQMDDAQLRATELIICKKEADGDIDGCRTTLENLRTILDFEENSFSTALNLLNEAMTLADSCSDDLVGAMVRIWLAIVLWADNKLQNSRNVFGDIFKADLSPYPCAETMLRGNWCGISLIEHTAFLLLFLLTIMKRPLEALEVAERLRRIYCNWSEDSWKITYSNIILDKDLLLKEYKSRTLVYCIQIENAVFFWILGGESDVQFWAYQMNNYKMHDLAMAIDSTYESEKNPKELKMEPWNRTPGIYKIQMPYKRAEEKVKKLVLAKIPQMGLIKARKRLEAALRTALRGSQFVDVISHKEMCNFPWKRLVEKLAPANQAAKIEIIPKIFTELDCFPAKLSEKERLSGDFLASCTFMNDNMSKTPTTAELSSSRKWGKICRLAMALRLVLVAPKRRMALLLLVHLVDKILERIKEGEKKLLYTLESCIVKQIEGKIMGLDDILCILGFKRTQTLDTCCMDIEWYFPFQNEDDILGYARNLFYALLHIPRDIMNAISRVSGEMAHIGTIVHILEYLNIEVLKLAVEDSLFVGAVLTKEEASNGISTPLFMALNLKAFPISNNSIRLVCILTESTMSDITQCWLALAGCFADKLSSIIRVTSEEASQILVRGEPSEIMVSKSPPDIPQEIPICDEDWKIFESDVLFADILLDKKKKKNKQKWRKKSKLKELHKWKSETALIDSEKEWDKFASDGEEREEVSENEEDKDMIGCINVEIPSSEELEDLYEIYKECPFNNLLVVLLIDTLIAVSQAQFPITVIQSGLSAHEIFQEFPYTYPTCALIQR
ncbi:Tetratricopeptide repeat protein 28 [Trichinella sp. T6]|nr:Tetratricopeptide repeat protein 28 [Trichinella sp. T6]